MKTERYRAMVIKADQPNKNGDVFPHDVLAEMGMNRHQEFPMVQK